MRFDYKYGGSTSVENHAGSSAMSFAPDTLREPTFFVGALRKSIAFREAISALNAVVVLDGRFQPRDLTAYKEWLKSQEEIWLADYYGSIAPDISRIENRLKDIRERLKEIQEGEGAAMNEFYKKKREYFNYLYKKDYDAWFVLDPVITVHPDEIFFECFSQDESAYGKLSCNYNVFKNINEFECGTTNIDYSAQLYNEFQKIRSYKETLFKVDPSGFEVETTHEETYKEVKIDLPDSWVRGFLQVSTAMTLDLCAFDLHPMEIQALCTLLRRYKEKEGPRSLKFILKPGQPIEIIAEPWNYKITCQRSIYKGEQSREIRIWGRRRLLTLERLIPKAKKFRVSLLGSGLPSFFEADLGDMTFTLGLSGWTKNDWSRSGNFNLMLPQSNVSQDVEERVFNALKENWQESALSLANRLNLETRVVHAALTKYTQRGRVIFDITNQVYRLRELYREPLDTKQFDILSKVEQKAKRLLEQNAVEAQIEEQGNQVKIHGRVRDAGRVYYTELILDADGRIKSASCTCNHYNMHQLRQGPCEHILAMRMYFSKTVLTQ